jgi:choline dehydrogenase-like flavoprotein
LLARFRERVDAHRHRLPLSAITEFMPDMRFGGSNFTLSSFGMVLAEVWERRGALLPVYAHHVVYYAMIKPDGVGRLWTLPGIAEPIATYRLTERDRRRLREGAGLLARALFAAGAVSVSPPVRGHPGWKNAADIERIPIPPERSPSLMTVHLFGSCPMGEHPDPGVVDSYGRLPDVENLVVADGSVLPGAPGVNPQATIMALSFRAVDAFLAERR